MEHKTIMKYGDVVHIRLSPEDVMGCIDVCKKSGILITGMSLAQTVKWAVAGLLESARAQGLIPRRDGYEYADMISPLLSTGRNARKNEITTTMELASISRIQNDLPAALGKLPAAGSPARQRKIQRLGPRIDELVAKKEIDPDNFTQDEQEGLDRLIEDLNTA